MKFCILFIFVFISLSTIYPCQCYEISVIEGVKSSDIVFKGTVLSIVKTTNYEDVGLRIDTTGLDSMVKQMKVYFPLYYVTVKIELLYKGSNHNTDTLKILTPASGASCGYTHFEKDNSYIIYANREDYFSKWSLPNKPLVGVEPNLYWTNHCTRTTDWYKEEEIEILKAIKED